MFVYQVHWLEALLSPYELRLVFSTNEVEKVELRAKVNAIRLQLIGVKLAFLDLLKPTGEVQALILFYRDQQEALIAERADIQSDVRTLGWMTRQGDFMRIC